MSGWATLGAGALGAGAGLLGGAIQGAASKNAAREQGKWNQYLYQNRYQWARKDMEAARLNPLLMMRTGPGSPQGVQQAQVPNYGELVSGGAARGIEALSKQEARKQTIATTENLQKTGLLLDAQRGELAEKIRQLGIQNRMGERAEIIDRWKTGWWDAPAFRSGQMGRATAGGSMFDSMAGTGFASGDLGVNLINAILDRLMPADTPEAKMPLEYEAAKNELLRLITGAPPKKKDKKNGR